MLPAERSWQRRRLRQRNNNNKATPSTHTFRREQKKEEGTEDAGENEVATTADDEEDAGAGSRGEGSAKGRGRKQCPCLSAPTPLSMALSVCVLNKWRDVIFSFAWHCVLFLLLLCFFLRCACAGNYIYLLFMKNRRGPPPGTPRSPPAIAFVGCFISFASHLAHRPIISETKMSLYECWCWCCC